MTCGEDLDRSSVDLQVALDEVLDQPEGKDESEQKIGAAGKLSRAGVFFDEEVGDLRAEPGDEKHL